jgi:halimadienyl-diphosphate synthase
MPDDTLDAAARALLADVASDPWGTVAVSLYDTGRLVALAPWLAGHQARIDFLCRRQRGDGGWGQPDGYAVVPTLSATTALLTELRRGSPRPEPVRRAVAGGLQALRRWFRRGAALTLPDTIGAELIVPALLEDLARLAPIERPAYDPRPLASARAGLAAGHLPPKTWACLEVFGPQARGIASVRPARGSVASSAAATAAWLGGPDGDRAAREFLDAVQARGGGPVPGVTPITYFEAAWVLNSLAVGGLATDVPAAILDRLDAGLSMAGAPAAPGLPADADDTAAVLSALLRHDRPRRPDCLLDYRVDGYFQCFHGERTPSVSANAHVLEALTLYLAHRPGERVRYAAPATLAANWLLAQQRGDGSWQDKWHASAYYATACCVLALCLHMERVGEVGGGPAGRATDRAVVWLLDTQRQDGSWGRWEGTVEETAYAVQTLAVAAPGRQAVAKAIRRGCGFLAHPPPLDRHQPLWHAKDLYTPVAVVRAAWLAALSLGSRVGAGYPPAPTSGTVPLTMLAAT